MDVKRPVHKCSDYAINVFVASSALNSGSLVTPRILGSTSVHYGAGHPLNRTDIFYPGSEGYMPEGSTVTPRISIIARRALLQGLLSALVSTKDIYRVGRTATCLHINTSSNYIEALWNEWLPDWDANGWPKKQAPLGDVDEETEMTSKPRSDAGSVRSGPSSTKQQRDRRLSSAPSFSASILSTQSETGLIFDDETGSLVNEDLLRKVAIYRRYFFNNEKADATGSVLIKLVPYRQNPADKLAKEASQAAALDLGSRLPRQRAGSNSSNGRASVDIGAASSRCVSISSTQSPYGSKASRARPARSVASIPEFAEQQQKPTPTKSRSRGPSKTAIAAGASVAAAAPLASSATATKADQETKSRPSAPRSSSRVSNSDARSARSGRSGYATDTDAEVFDDAVSGFGDEMDSEDEDNALSSKKDTPHALLAGGAAPGTQNEIQSSNKASDQPGGSPRRSFEKEINDAFGDIGNTEKRARPPKSEKRGAVAAVGSTVNGRSSEKKTPQHPLQRNARAPTNGVQTREEVRHQEASANEVSRDSGAPEKKSKAWISTAQAPEDDPALTKSRSRFFTLGRRSKSTIGKGERSSTLNRSSAAPPDRLTDYRPPQNGRIRSMSQSQDTRGAPQLTEDDDITPSPSTAGFGNKYASRQGSMAPSTKSKSSKKRFPFFKLIAPKNPIQATS